MMMINMWDDSFCVRWIEIIGGLAECHVAFVGRVSSFVVHRH